MMRQLFTQLASYIFKSWAVVLLSTMVLPVLATAKPSGMNPDAIIGVWQSYDDKTNDKKGQVEFFYDKKSNSYAGRIVKVTPAKGYKPKTHCYKCPKPFTGKKIEGMLTTWNLKPLVRNGKFGGRYDEGYLIDPTSGKIYRLRIYVSKNKKIMKLRGYIGTTLIGRGQTWTRVK